MIRQEAFYSTHFETIVALTTYLAVSESGEIDSANAFRLAKQLGLQLEDVQLVLDNATGILIAQVFFCKFFQVIPSVS